jgi:hypothetical protein
MDSGCWLDSFAVDAAARLMVVYTDESLGAAVLLSTGQPGQRGTTVLVLRRPGGRPSRLARSPARARDSCDRGCSSRGIDAVPARR